MRSFQPNANVYRKTFFLLAPSLDRSFMLRHCINRWLRIISVDFFRSISQCKRLHIDPNNYVTYCDSISFNYKLIDNSFPW